MIFTRANLVDLYFLEGYGACVPSVMFRLFGIATISGPRSSVRVDKNAVSAALSPDTEINPFGSVRCRSEPD